MKKTINIKLIQFFIIYLIMIISFGISLKLPNLFINTEPSPRKITENTCKKTNHKTEQLIPLPQTNELKQIIYFDFGKAKILESDIPKLKSFLSEIKKITSEGITGKLSIEGHTDSIGSHKYNQRLGKDRAKNIGNKLYDIGLDRQYKFNIKSWGETLGARDNKTKEGRALNRRVVLTFKIEKANANSINKSYTSDK